MQFIWETSDVLSAMGTVVHRGVNTEHYIVGYEKGSGLNPCLISLRDGMVCHVGLDLDKFATMLNEEKFRPLVFARPSIESIAIDRRDERWSGA